VNSASSSNASAQSLPQKRRTLSSGFSQYQHEPLAGKLWRGRTGADGATACGSAVALLFGKLSCIVSKIHPLPGSTSIRKARLLQRNTVSMRNLKHGTRTASAAADGQGTPSLHSMPGLRNVADEDICCDEASAQHAIA
jgi:hypothetical protein